MRAAILIVTTFAPFCMCVDSRRISLGKISFVVLRAVRDNFKYATAPSLFRVRGRGCFNCFGELNVVFEGIEDDLIEFSAKE